MSTVKIVLRKKLKNGEFRIAIRYAHQKESAKYINLPLRCKPEQWHKEKQRFRKNKIGYKEMNEALSEIEDQIEEALSGLHINQNPSFDAFEKAFYHDEKKDDRTIKEVFQDKLAELKAANRHGSYITYKGCFVSLEKYAALDVDFTAITYKFLKGFEQYHLQLGNKPNTIGNYLRSLRALHYEYCKINTIQEPNVYKTFNIARLRNDTEKRSLSKDQLKTFINYSPKTKAEKNAQLLFLFSFYCRGINILDMLQLTDKNIRNEILIYTRHKTGKLLKVKLIKESLDILEYFKSDSIYLFPYVRVNDIPKYRIKSINRYVNEQLEKISQDLKFDERLSFYSARHSYAELSYKGGVRIEIISQMLGHSDLKTTQTYLRSFSDDEVDNAASQIFDSL